MRLEKITADIAEKADREKALVGEGRQGRGEHRRGGGRGDKYHGRMPSKGKKGGEIWKLSKDR